MSKTNRKCLNCGEDYYVCKNCVSIHSWKNICCSPECFREYMSKTNAPTEAIETNTWEDIKLSVIMRGCLNDGKTIDIVAYDPDLGKIDCTDEITKVTSDFRYFIVPVDEMQEIFNKMTSKKRTTKKNNSKVAENNGGQ